MTEYIKWLENKIEVCLQDKDLQREHWAFCQAFKKYRELALTQPPVLDQSEQLVCENLIRHNFSISKINVCLECKFIKDRAK
jgi:hypothetical protein